MRVLLVALLAGSALLLGACSDGGENILRRQQSSNLPDRTPSSKTSKGGDDNAKPTPDPSPAPSSDTPAPNPSPATDAGAPKPPAPPPTPGSCGAPKCLAGGGLGGCKATDAAGNAVTMGCQDGACACFAGNQTTSTFDGDPNSADEARELFLTNCDCQ